MTFNTFTMEQPRLATTRQFRTAVTLKQIQEFRVNMRIYLRQSMMMQGYPLDMVDEMLLVFPLDDFVGEDNSTVARRFEEFFMAKHGAIWEVFDLF